jgi:hypothetical protein
VVWWPHFRQRTLEGNADVTIETKAAAVNTSPEKSLFDRPAE